MLAQETFDGLLLVVAVRVSLCFRWFVAQVLRLRI